MRGGAGGGPPPLHAVVLLCLLCSAAAAAAARAGGGGTGGGGPAPTPPPGPALINPSANVFLGAMVALRARGAGLFGCGAQTLEGKAVLDSVQALTEAVNSEKPGLPSIPRGVSLGVRVFDHCGRPRVAVAQLAELLPELGPGGPAAGHPPATPHTVGVLDGAGLTRTDSDADLEVRRALAEAMVPVAAVDSSHLVQPLQRAQALVAVLQRLEWRRFVVVRGSDAYSEDLWQSLSQLAAGLRAADFCVDSVETFDHEGPGLAQRSAESTASQEVLDVVTDAAVAGLPVVVLMPRAGLRPFLESLREALFEADMPPAAPAALMLLLSDLVAHEDARLLPTGATVYSLATPGVADGAGPAAARVLRDLMPAADAADAADTLADALRSDGLLAAAQPVLAFALALKRSWRDKCPGKQSGVCPPWAAMSRPEFLNAYFAPLAAGIARGERPPDWEPQWGELLLPPRDLVVYRYHAVDGRQQVRPVLRASTVSVSNNNSVASSSSVSVLDEGFHPEEVGVCATRPSVPSAAECERTCLPLQRPSRTGGGRRIESWTNYQDDHLQGLQRDGPDGPQPQPAEVLDSDSEPAALRPTDLIRLVESPQRVYLLLLLPLRRGPADTVLDCAGVDEDQALDVQAVRRAEAFLWAVQRMNQQLARDAGPRDEPLQVGALVGDTCASRLRAMTLAAGLRPANHDPGEKADRVLAVVNALPLPAARLAADILAERNVTSIAVAQLGAAGPPSPFQLQVDLPLSQMVEAMVQALQQLGWTYVSVVQAHGESPASDHVDGKRMFMDAAAKAGVCVALEVTLPWNSGGEDDEATEEAAVSRLLGARAGGARGVVVWADAAGVRRLFRAVTRAIAQGSLRREDLFWMLASPEGDAREVLAEFGNVLAGAAVFSPQRRGVAEFQHFLRQETAAAAADVRAGGGGGGVTGSDHELRWLRLYRERCGGDTVCPADEPAAVAGDWAVVQSVQALAAVLSQLASCPDSDRPWTRGGDVCLPDGGPRPLDAVLADALRWTPSPRADGPVGAEFRFSPDGVGQLAVDVDNFRRRPGAARSRSLGDVHFQRVATFLNGKLTPLDDGLVAYKDSGDEVRVATLTSQCGGNLGSCHRCRQLRGRPNSALGDWLVVEPPPPQQKEPTVYMLATIDVHEPSPNPLQCGQEVSARGMEQLEAFLWAVDQVNSNYSGLRVGAVAVDTCGSSTRTARLVSELLAEAAEQAGGGAELGGGPAGAVVAVLAGGGTPVATPAMEAAAALGLPSVAPAARGPPPHRKTHPPYPLQLGPSNNMLAESVVVLMQQLRWRCVAALYLQDAVDYEETYRQVEGLALRSNISVTGVAVPTGAHSAASTRSSGLRHALLRVREAQSLAHGGARGAVLLLLPAWCVDAVLRTAASLEDEGLWDPEAVTLLAVGGEAEAAFLAHSRQALGALVVRPRAAAVPEFERHFRALRLEENRRNPWFPEFWSGVFHCRGSACRAGPAGPEAGRLRRGLDAYQMAPNPDIANTINAVLAMGHALQTVRRELCPEGSSGPGAAASRQPCRAMTGMTRVRARLLELAPRMAFVGVGPNAVAFSENGENTNVAVEVLNVQVSAHSKAAVAVTVAEVSASGTLSGMAADAARAYVGPEREPVDLLGVLPTCSAAVTTTSTTTTTTEVPEPAAAAGGSNKYLMEMPGVGVGGEPAPALLVLLAAHAPAQAAGLGPGGLGPLHCGELDADALCHLAGAMFAVHRANENASLLQGQGPKLGLIALDTCGQPGRAYSGLFSLLSQPQPARTAPVAALVLDDAALVTPMVSPLLHMQAISQLNSTAEREPQRQVVVQARQAALSDALLDVAVALQGHGSPAAEAQTNPEAAASSSPASSPPSSSPSLVVLHGSAPRARSLARHLESASLARCPAHDHDHSAPGPGCLTAVLPMPVSASPAGDNGRSGPLYLLSTQAANSVVILALDSVDEARAVLLAAQSPLVPRLVFLTALPEGPEVSRTALRADGHSVLSMVADSTVTAATATPRDGSLDAAFQEWLARHHATMEDVGMPAAWADSIRASPCDLDHDQWSRADITQAVERVARGVLWAAGNASRAEDDGHLAVRVARYLEAAAETADAAAAAEGTTMPPPPQVDTFRIWRGDEALGSWSPQSGLRLSTDPSLLLDELAVSSRPTLFHNLQYAWAVALLVITLLGILFTLLTAVFFLSAAAVSKTPISGGAGTSVLGYLILLGLLLLHCAVLSLVLAPGEVTCGARRMLPALAYALIFAAMFLKVLTTWRVCDRKGGVVRPAALVLRALGLAAPQVLVTAGWLALAPAAVHMVGPAHWQCDSAHAPGSGHGPSQAPHLLLSLAYTCLLMVATAVLALLCSSKEELLEEGTMLRQESRWILVSAVAVAAQLGCWGLAVVAASTASPLAGPGRADLLAASVHALAAATLLLCLFLPKVRLYLRLRRDARNTAAIAASAAARSAASRSQPIYGISHFQPFGGKLNPAFDAPSTDMSLGESASQSASDRGSHSVSGSASEAEGDYNDPLDPTQVVPSSLYSIDMFSSQDSSSQGISDLPVVAMATGDGRGTVRGTLCGVRPHPHQHLHPHASLFGTVRGERCLGGTLRSAHGGTLRSVQALVQGGTVRGPPGARAGGTPRCALTNLHGTVRAPRGGPRVSHFLPGSNEFTAPHRSSSMLLLPGQESISYM